MLFVFGTIFFGFFQLVANQNNSNKYGPYYLDWLEIAMCKGPKSANCGNIQLENSKIPTDIIFLLDMPKDCQISAAKVEVSSIQNNNKKKLWHSILNKPCQHFVLGPLLQEALNVTGMCKIYKGQYNVHVNLDKKTKVFLGNGFFYGSFNFKVTAFNRDNNVFCVNSIIDVVKLKS